MSELTTSEECQKNLQKVRIFAHWIVLFGGTLLGGLFIIISTYNAWYDPGTRQVLQAHFAAVIGLPSAAIGSLCVVLFLEGTSGTIEIEGFGVKFKGAAGPLIFWVICFLAITAAIKICW